MSYKNNEGYSDPTAGKAVQAAGRMPTHIYNAFCVLNNTAGLLGLEITGIRDRKNRKRMEKALKRRRPGAFTLPAKSMKKKKMFSNMHYLLAVYR